MKSCTTEHQTLGSRDVSAYNSLRPPDEIASTLGKDLATQKEKHESGEPAAVTDYRARVDKGSVDIFTTQESREIGTSVSCI